MGTWGVPVTGVILYLCLYLERPFICLFSQDPLRYPYMYDNGLMDGRRRVIPLSEAGGHPFTP